MTTRGNLKDLGFRQLLLALSRGEESGKLSVTRPDTSGVVVLRRGRIIYAGTSRVRETIGNILVCRHLISEDTLSEALERQVHATEEVRLGNILLDMGAVSEQHLRDAMRQQVETVLQEMATWEHGFFRFDHITFPEHGEIEIDAQDLALQPDSGEAGVVVKLSVEAEEPGPGRFTADAPAADGGEQLAASRLASLTAVAAEIRSPAFTAEITLRLLSYAAQTVSRGVLFVVRGNEARGMGQFNIDLGGSDADTRVRALKVPLDEPSVLAHVVGRREAYQGPLETTPWNDKLVNELGGKQPSESIAVPMTVSSLVALVLYGDNLPGDRPIGHVHGLGLLMEQAGLAMERVVLERRIQQVDNRLGGKGRPKRRR